MYVLPTFTIIWVDQIDEHISVVLVHFMSCGISVNNVQEGEIGSGNGFGFKLALYEVSVPMSPLKSLRRHS